MRRVALSQLRHRPARALALLLGILVATTAFTVLTGASATGRLQARGRVAKHFLTAYDILVRPRGARSVTERKRGLVRPGALSGISGGISMAQWRHVLDAPGVDAAAPIAVIGYTLPDANIKVDLTRDARGRSPVLFRVRVTRVTDRGLTRRRDVPAYVWVTDRELLPERGTGNISDPANYAPRLSRGDRTWSVCASDYQRFAPDGPFDLGPEGAARGGPFFGNAQCWSRRSGFMGFGRRAGSFGFPAGRLGATVPDPLPFVVAAIDPEQEARLTGLAETVTAGRFLRPTDQPTGGVQPAVPALLSTRAFADETTEVTIERLPARAARRMGQPFAPVGNRLRGWLDSQPGRLLRGRRFGPGAALRALAASSSIPTFWSVGETAYDEHPDGVLAPRTAHNPPEAWLGPGSGGFVLAPLSADDIQFRRIQPHQGATASQIGEVFAGVHVVGRFDPTRLPSFDDVLSIYRAPGLAGADSRSRRLLGGRPLLPNGNVGGYETQPPLLLTNLNSLGRFGSPHYDSPLPKAPISAIRVRVAGVHGIDALSRERVRRTAEAISSRTGLDVDLTVGSSPSPVTVALAAGRHGRPALTLTEPWVKLGVGVSILEAVDRKSLALFALILVVCAVFVANAAGASVRARRTELGVLACLGWSRGRLFGVVLGEVGLIGLAAGLVGSGIALPLASAVGVETSLMRSGLAVPAATLLALVAGAVPAARAARATPVDAVRPAVAPVRVGRRPRGVAGLALVNLLRVPGRTLLGALSLAVGVAALTTLLAVTIAFRGALVGSVLGDLVSVKVRTVDYVAVVTTILLGAAAIADVLFLNLRERAGELATLRATGWDDRALGRLVALEGIGIGLAGAIPGALAGLVASGLLADGVPGALILVTLLAIIAGTTVAAIAAVIPAALLRRVAPVPLLAAE
jgi:putative ABC transport system permease protein